MHHAAPRVRRADWLIQFPVGRRVRKQKTKTMFTFRTSGKAARRGSQKDPKTHRPSFHNCTCAHLTVYVWKMVNTVVVVVVVVAAVVVPQGSMILEYLCLWAIFFSVCCPQCQDHHGKSSPMGNTTDQGLTGESSFHYPISSGPIGPSELFRFTLGLHPSWFDMPECWDSEV